MQPKEDLIVLCNKETTLLFSKAQETVIYRPSIAYVLQHVKSFISAIQQFKQKPLSQLEERALERFHGITSHFNTVLPNLSSNWVQSMLSLPSTHMHEYIDKYRKNLIEICKQLSLESDKVITFDTAQDTVNKVADLQYLKTALREVRESAISVANAVDIQQLIELRLHSIAEHLPQKKGRNKIAAIPSSDNLPVNQLREKMENALDAFKSIDISDNDLKIEDSLGCGGFGTVYKATRLSTGELLAVKEVRSDKLTMSTWASLYSELATMAKLKHRYVLELVGAHVKEPYRIITRFCPGKSLFDRLHRNNSESLTPQQLTMLAYQVSEGMKFLHKNGIVHRDLKTMNILLDDCDAARIADFGLSGLVKDNKELMGGVGTPHYTAPEVLDRKRYGPKVDSYSFGMILWEMATNQIPFRDKSHAEIIEHVVTRGWRLNIPNSVPSGMKKLINRCWSTNPNDRPDFDEITDLFRRGKVFFEGTPQLKNPESLEAPPETPAIDIPYVTEVLKNPSVNVFPQVADFIVSRMSKKLQSFLRDSNIISSYDSNSQNPGIVLVILGELLLEDEFKDVMVSTAIPIIENLLVFPQVTDIICILRFLIRIPINLFSMIERFLSQIITKINEPQIGELLIQLFSKIDPIIIKSYGPNILEYLIPKNISLINDQSTVDSLILIAPHIINIVPKKSIFIPVLEKKFVFPPSFAKLIIENIDSESIVPLLCALLEAANQIDLEEAIPLVLKNTSTEHFISLSEKPGVFDKVNQLIIDKKNTHSAYLLLYHMTSVESIPPKLSSHPVLHSLLTAEGNVAQRLQIFTSLFLSEQFLEDTTISDGVLKLLVSSMSVDSLTVYAIRLIGSLSTHQSGCKMISETGMLSLFSQVFLSPVCSELATSMTILRNLVKFKEDIPQISLIVSCLMQDLMYAISNKFSVLQTLIDIIGSFRDSVQEHDLQNVVLPLVSTRQEPAIVVLALRLFQKCDPSKLRLFYHQIAMKILSILKSEQMMYPQVIAECASMISVLSLQFDIKKFIEQTQLLTYIDSTLDQIKEFNEIHQNLLSVRLSISYSISKKPTAI